MQFAEIPRVTFSKRTLLNKNFLRGKFKDNPLKVLETSDGLGCAAECPVTHNLNSQTLQCIKKTCDVDQLLDQNTGTCSSCDLTRNYVPDVARTKCVPMPTTCKTGEKYDIASNKCITQCSSTSVWDADRSLCLEKSKCVGEKAISSDGKNCQKGCLYGETQNKNQCVKK